MQSDGLHAWIEAPEGEREVVLRLLEPGVLFAGPPGPDVRPTGCGQDLLWKPTARDRAEILVERLDGLCSEARRVFDDFLVEHF